MLTWEPYNTCLLALTIITHKLFKSFFFLIFQSYNPKGSIARVEFFIFLLFMIRKNKGFVRSIINVK